MKIKTRFNFLLCIILILGMMASCIGCRQAATSSDSLTAENTIEVVSDDLDIMSSLPEEATESKEATESLETTGSEETTETEETTEAAEMPQPPETTEADSAIDQQPTETTQASNLDDIYTFEPRNETVYTTTPLNIRKAPSSDADIVTALSISTPITRTGYHEEWSRLDYNGVIVYAVSEYLSTVKPTVSEPENSIENLDKTILHFGYDQNGPRDENNAPAGMAWYIRNWGKWATFLQDTKKKEIYLTFNMGYEIGYTAGILDILKEHNIKAVFFLVGEYAETAPDLVWRMINEGHILGNHSYAHPPGGLPTLSLQDQIADTIYMHNLVKNKYGYDMKLYRFPSGAYSTQSLEAISWLGYKQVFYSFYYHDYDEKNQPDPTEALKTSLEQLHPGAIYMFHTISSTNAQIFAEWVNGVLAQGYTFGIYPVE